MCTRYHGPDRAADREPLTVTGTVIEQILGAYMFVAEHVRAGEAPTAGQAQTTDLYHFPMVAVRETIANALAHRDYTAANRCVHVRLFPERLEVTSPGEWLGRSLKDGVEYSLSALESHSIKRNFRLAHVLSWIRLVEGEGSGIPSALKDCRSVRAPEPTVVQNQGFVTVTLRRRESDPQTGPARLPIPIQLPPNISDYVGRDYALAMLDALLPDASKETAGPRIQLISGLAGVGKTATAVHWAHRVRDRFPDGILFANLGGARSGSPAEPTETMRRFLHAFGVRPDDVPGDLDTMTSLYRSLLHDRRVLILLDDAVSIDQVRPLIPAGPGCAALVTSRGPLDELVVRDGAQVLPLGTLSMEEAKEFLARRLGRDRVAADPEAAATLVRFCAGLPLAMAVVAARATRHPRRPLGELAGELVDATDRLDVLSLSDGALSLRTVFNQSYGELSTRAAAVFRLLGVHPSPNIGLGAAIALTGLNLREARDSLDELVTAGMLDEPVPLRYRSHDLLHDYAAELAAQTESQEVTQEAIRRVVDYYLQAGTEAARLLNPRREPIVTAPPAVDVLVDTIEDYDQAMGWFSVEVSGLASIIECASQAGLERHAWQLAWVLAPFLDVRGHWTLMLDCQRTALALAEQFDDLAAQAASHRLLSRAYSRIDHDREAIDHLARAHDLYRDLDDLNGQANTAYDLAEIHHLRRQYPEAVGHARRAVGLYERIGDTSGVRDALQLVGQITYERVGHEGAPRDASPSDSHTSLPTVHRTIVIADVVGFSSRRRTSHDRSLLRTETYRALHDAFVKAGIPWDSCYIEDRGDGVLILAPPEVPKSFFVERLPETLSRELIKHNQVHPSAQEIRLRVALHAGEVHADQHGVAGSSLNHAFRILEASELKEAVATSPPAPLGLITSDWFYREVVQPSEAVDSESFRRVDVHVKETRSQAWIRVLHEP
ncbi:NB-ARC domain-containing protein [Actinomadura madurae]|uniref:NB-ARC domain-containing protein n=2 Tax=Actinomadura madurae TaxID=1993 RepID=A0A1I5VPX8_9ACTN|nr:ATP-binding protein [Actinomadura madurae]SFQ09502.1 NB-ARC domain-containing protein [Actinomadura madurae]